MVDRGKSSIFAVAQNARAQSLAKQRFSVKTASSKAADPGSVSSQMEIFLRKKGRYTPKFDFDAVVVAKHADTQAANQAGPLSRQLGEGRDPTGTQSQDGNQEGGGGRASTSQSSGAEADEDDRDDASLNDISDTLLLQATVVLDRVLAKYGTSAEWVKESFGPPISVSTAQSVLASYVKENGLQGRCDVIWTSKPLLMSCGGKTVTEQVYDDFGRRLTKTSVWVSSSQGGAVIFKERGIVSFAEHELGTHVMRRLNDGSSNLAGMRERHGWAVPSARQRAASEEGLATIHTVMQLKPGSEFFWSSALTYFAAAHARRKNFAELWALLERYVPDGRKRFHLCLKCKAGLADQAAPGGSGKKQCYFEGIVGILRAVQRDAFDPVLMMSGKMEAGECVSPERFAGAAKQEVEVTGLLLPSYLKGKRAVGRYLEACKQIAALNGIGASDDTDEVRMVQARLAQEAAAAAAVAAAVAAAARLTAVLASNRASMIVAFARESRNRELQYE
jgi:hypothetical protein